MIEQELTDALEQFVKAVTKGVTPPGYDADEDEARRSLIYALDRYIDKKIAAQLLT